MSGDEVLLNDSEHLAGVFWVRLMGYECRDFDLTIDFVVRT